MSKNSQPHRKRFIPFYYDARCHWDGIAVRLISFFLYFFYDQFEYGPFGVITFSAEHTKPFTVLLGITVGATRASFENARRWCNYIYIVVNKGRWNKRILLCCCVVKNKNQSIRLIIMRYCCPSFSCVCFRCHIKYSLYAIPFSFSVFVIMDRWFDGLGATISAFWPCHQCNVAHI